MILTRRRSGFPLLCAAGVLIASISSALAQRSGTGPFADLTGSWVGTGSIMLSSGDTESIRCRANYTAGQAGYTLQQGLRCASDSYNFNLSSDIRTDGGAITGSWQETTRGVSGEVSGRASGGTIQARVDSPGFTANLSLATRGDRQSVTIRSQGTELAGVSITLRRGSR
jgi:hypothetical protein